MVQNSVKNIAIVGGRGLAGGAILDALLEAGRFNLTAISRNDSTATFPDSVTVQKGDYADAEFLKSALTGQDVLIITLSVFAAPDTQTNLIKAAAAAGVPWILPNEYGQDGNNAELSKAVPILGGKKKIRDFIESTGVSWIGIACNLWIDFGLKGGWYSVDINTRTATLYDEGTNPVVTASIPQVGRGVAKLLSLPVESSTGPSLSDYKNKFAYLRSFNVSQVELLEATQRATGTKPEDWTVTKKDLEEYIKEGNELMKTGNRMGMRNILYGNTFKKGLGDQFHGQEVANEKIGLEDEKLDDVVRRVVQELEQEKK